MKEAPMSMLRNPAFLLAWGLPLVAVVASVLTLFITIRHPEGQLPEQYHWEGFQLDRDFSQAAKAASLGVRARLTGFSAAGRCEVQLSARASAPDTLVLWVAHATLPALDQKVTLERSGQGAVNGASTYSGACREAPEGHWRLELIDAATGWAVRQSVRGTLGDVTLDAVAGQNE
jgi:hypothetical protein